MNKLEASNMGYMIQLLNLEIKKYYILSKMCVCVSERGETVEERWIRYMRH
jgi:hypothetical protein